jgi:hypothetical protein
MWRKSLLFHHFRMISFGANRQDEDRVSRTIAQSACVACPLSGRRKAVFPPTEGAELLHFVEPAAEG